SGWPKLKIEEAAARKQAAIDRGEEVIVGVNKFRTDDQPMIDARDIDNDKVRAQQLARIQKIKGTRDQKKLDAALAALTEGARGSANLLALAVAAARGLAHAGRDHDAA